MNIEIWSPGKANDDFIEQGIQYYFKKTRPWNPVELVVMQVPKKETTNDPLRAKLIEEEMILKKLQPYHYLILLDERGKLLDSLQWSQQIQACMNQGTKTLVFLVGGAFGVTDKIRKAARQTWSLSALVFPHQMVRLLLAEQIYRSFSILNHSPYHHQ